MKGSIRIRIHVSSEGIPLEYNLIKSSGHDILDKAALEVIPRWKFRSSSESYSVEKNIIFELKDN